MLIFVNVNVYLNLYIFNIYRNNIHIFINFILVNSHIGTWRYQKTKLTNNMQYLSQEHIATYIKKNIDFHIIYSRIKIM